MVKFVSRAVDLLLPLGDGDGEDVSSVEIQQTLSIY